MSSAEKEIASLRSELSRVREDRNELIRAVLLTTAPLCWGTTGTAASAIHQLEYYVSKLELIAESLAAELAGQCATHPNQDSTEACFTCLALLRLKELNITHRRTERTSND